MGQLEILIGFDNPEIIRLVAKAEGEAQSTLVRAKAQATANKLLQTTLSQSLIQSKAIDKWDGRLPQITGGATPFIDLKSLKSTKE